MRIKVIKLYIAIENKRNYHPKALVIINFNH